MGIVILTFKAGTAGYGGCGGWALSGFSCGDPSDYFGVFSTIFIL